MAKISTNYGGGDLAIVTPCDPQTISSINPDEVGTNQDDVLITVIGTNLTNMANVVVTDGNNNLATSDYTYVNDTQITFLLDTDLNVGFYDLIITNQCNAVTLEDAIEIIQNNQSFIPGSVANPWDNCN